MRAGRALLRRRARARLAGPCAGRAMSCAEASRRSTRSGGCVAPEPAHRFGRRGRLARRADWEAQRGARRRRRSVRAFEHRRIEVDRRSAIAAASAARCCAAGPGDPGDPAAARRDAGAGESVLPLGGRPPADRRPNGCSRRPAQRGAPLPLGLHRSRVPARRLRDRAGPCAERRTAPSSRARARTARRPEGVLRSGRQRRRMDARSRRQCRRAAARFALRAPPSSRAGRRERSRASASTSASVARIRT